MTEIDNSYNNIIKLIINPIIRMTKNQMILKIVNYKEQKKESYHKIKIKINIKFKLRIL